MLVFGGVVGARPLSGCGTKCIFSSFLSGGVGWGGVGMLPFLELAHMVDATSSVGFGVGWGCYRSLNLHTWSLLHVWFRFFV